MSRPSRRRLRLWRARKEGQRAGVSQQRCAAQRGERASDRAALTGCRSLDVVAAYSSASSGGMGRPYRSSSRVPCPMCATSLASARASSPCALFHKDESSWVTASRRGREGFITLLPALKMARLCARAPSASLRCTERTCGEARGDDGKAHDHQPSLARPLEQDRPSPHAFLPRSSLSETIRLRTMRSPSRLPAGTSAPSARQPSDASLSSAK